MDWIYEINRNLEGGDCIASHRQAKGRKIIVAVRGA
jgi:hypothetical protein